MITSTPLWGAANVIIFKSQCNAMQLGVFEQHPYTCSHNCSLIFIQMDETNKYIPEEPAAGTDTYRPLIKVLKRAKMYIIT